MKKIIFITLIAACAAMGVSSCMNGDYDANPAGVATGTNPLVPVTPANNGSNLPSYYSWTGTDPLSAKIDGTGYTATVAVATLVGANLQVQASGDGKTFTITFPGSTANGVVLPLSSATVTTVSYTEGTDSYSSSMGTGGGVYIEENDASHVKGKFFANVKSAGGGTKSITDGFFNINK